MRSQLRSKRSPTGSRYVDFRKKKSNELGGFPILTKIGKLVFRKDRTLGNNEKQRVLVAETANVYDPKTRKYAKSAIKMVEQNPANRNFIRRNILTKGAIIETEAGKARVTGRPGQDGTVNAVLVTEK